MVEQGRLGLSQEFLKAMTDPAARRRAGIFGVLLSGPNGVGESAVQCVCGWRVPVLCARAVRSVRYALLTRCGA